MKINYWISVDDYCDENYKLAKLLSKYSLDATFFIELQKNNDRYHPKNQIKVLDNFGFDIGCHSIYHPILRNISELDQDLNIYYAKGCIEELIGKELKWYAPPKGKYNKQVIDKIIDAGFKYIRTVDVLDTSDIHGGINSVSIHPFPRREYKDERWIDVAMDQINNISIYGGTFKMMMHAWELENLNYWGELELIFKELHKYGKSVHLER
jgi:peptidoglycan/xylan/chitin deacetylase (PgdA/CDA1 family)